MLSVRPFREEERTLAWCFREHGAPKARLRLVASNLRPTPLGLPTPS
jgi:hypothetical protein